MDSLEDSKRRTDLSKRVLGRNLDIFSMEISSGHDRRGKINLKGQKERRGMVNRTEEEMGV